MPITRVPKNPIVEAIRSTAQRMQQPIDDNVLKARLLGFLGAILENQLPTVEEQLLPMPATIATAGAKALAGKGRWVDAINESIKAGDIYQDAGYRTARLASLSKMEPRLAEFWKNPQNFNELLRRSEARDRLRPLVRLVSPPHSEFNISELRTMLERDILKAIATGDQTKAREALLQVLPYKIVDRLDSLTLQPLPEIPPKELYIKAEEAGYPLQLFHGTRDTKLKKMYPAIGYEPGHDYGIHAGNFPTAANFVQRAGNDAVIYPLVSRTPEESIQDLPDMIEWKSPRNWIEMAEQPGLELTTPAFLGSKTYGPNLAVNIGSRGRSVLDQVAAMASEFIDAYPVVSSEAKSVNFQKNLSKILDEHGIEAIRYPNFSEGIGDYSYLFRKPEHLRSILANFDPKKKHINDLMASILGTTAVGSAVAAGRTSNQK